MVLKKILYTGFSCFLVVVTYQLLRDIFFVAFTFAIRHSIIISALLNLYVTGIFVFVGFVFPTHQVLPQSYFVVWNKSTLLSAYKYLGVKYFKYVLLLFFWRYQKNRKRFFNGTKGGIKNFIYQSIQAETGHFLALITLIIIAVWLIILGHYKAALFTTLINYVVNFLPVLLQRFHRTRLQKLTKFKAHS